MYTIDTERRSTDTNGMGWLGPCRVAPGGDHRNLLEKWMYSIIIIETINPPRSLRDVDPIHQWDQTLLLLRARTTPTHQVESCVSGGLSAHVKKNKKNTTCSNLAKSLFQRE